MRLREPLQGVKLASGHALVHISLLYGSLILVDTKKISDDSVEGYYNEKTGTSLLQCIFIARVCHIACILSQFVQIYAKSIDSKIAEAFMLMYQVFVFMGSVLYLQFNVSNSNINDWHTPGRSQALYWMMIEVLTLYLTIFSTIMFLFKTQMRGLMGKTIQNSKTERFKFDAIEYYKMDIDWFGFIFIFFCIDSFIVFLINTGKLNSYDVGEITDNELITETYLLYIIVFSRILQLIYIPNCRNQYREMVVISHFKWFFFIVLYVGVVIGLFFVPGDQIVIRSVIQMDTMAFSLLFLLYNCYRFFQQEQFEGYYSRDDNQIRSALYSNIIQDEYGDIDGPIGEDLSVKKVKIERKSIRQDLENLAVAKIMLQDDIYSFAYAAFLDPEQLTQNENDEDMLQIIKMNPEEIQNIFIGAVMIIGCQLTVMGMIVDYELTAPEFEMVPSKSFVIILARFLSALMMNLNVEPEIRCGLILAKYCMNHPNRFRGAFKIGPDGQEVINIYAILPPFFLAISQAMIALLVQINILVFLTSQQSLLGVITKFVCLGAICKFDDMYAASLYDNKMKAAGGKKLKKYYFRHHEFLRNKYEKINGECKKSQTDLLGYSTPYKIDGREFYLNPRRNSIVLKIMRAFVKFCRMIYVCVLYYFMPFAFVAITFMQSLPPIKSEFKSQSQDF